MGGAGLKYDTGTLRIRLLCRGDDNKIVVNRAFTAIPDEGAIQLTFHIECVSSRVRASFFSIQSTSAFVLISEQDHWHIKSQS